MSQLRLRIFDGTRQPFAAPANFLISITDGNQQEQIRQFYPQNDLTFDGLPFFDNFGDDYTVLVSLDGYKQAGYQPVKLSDKFLTTLDLMLVRNDPGFNFSSALYPAAAAAYPFIAAGVPETTAEQRYTDLLDTGQLKLACLLNLCEAMSQISLAQGNPLTYFKQLRFDPPFDPAQDRFFAWCNVALIDQVKAAAAKGQFAVELDPGLLHPGATSSWKQVQFGEGNVQLTFHEGDKMVIDGVNCVTIEPDMDYYKDPLNHAILEVVFNALTHSLTNSVEVYVLRWIAGQTAGIPEFAPLYTIT